ncbi:MAG: dihydrodipicolinate synthase family protein [Phycisphaerales bacterium]
MDSSNRKRLKGIFAPIATPFADDEALDIRALAHNMALYRETGLRGYLVLGSNGENKSLSEEERQRAVDVVLEGRGDEQVVIAGVMYEAQRHAEQSLDWLASRSVEYALVQSPSYFRKQLTDDCLYRYFTTLADRARIPVLLYNSPGFNGMTLSFELIQRLSEHPNIVGMKDSTPGCDLKIMDLDRDDFCVMVGSIGKLRGFVEKGSIGGTVSLADYSPSPAVRLHEALMEGWTPDSESLNQRLNEANHRIAGQFGVPGVKAAMNLLGFRGGIPRRPLCPLDANQIVSVRTALIEAGALEP